MKFSSPKEEAEAEKMKVMRFCHMYLKVRCLLNSFRIASEISETFYANISLRFTVVYNYS